MTVLNDVPVILAIASNARREARQILLSASGYRVLPAENGVEVFSIVRAVGGPFVLLLDADLPGPSGRAIARLLRERGMLERIPVLLFVNSPDGGEGFEEDLPLFSSLAPSEELLPMIKSLRGLAARVPDHDWHVLVAALGAVLD